MNTSYLTYDAVSYTAKGNPTTTTTPKSLSSHEPTKQTQSTDVKATAQHVHLNQIHAAPKISEGIPGRPPLATVPNVAVVSSESFHIDAPEVLGMMKHRRGRIISLATEGERDNAVHGLRRYEQGVGDPEMVLKKESGGKMDASLG